MDTHQLEELMAEHTPGPWHIDYKPEHRAIVAANGQPVASTMIPGRTIRVADADARLIAAAPELKEQRDELLAALEALIQDIDDTGFADCGTHSVIENARTTIAKAKGG